MPRCARVKTYDSIFHIMVRSIDDTLLFRDDYDKDRFLELVKKYQDIYSFKVYAYCLMDNHGHMIIDAAGADISKIMHGINQSYAQSFNRRHGRRGHLFWDRFKSKIVSDEKYILALSGYIHNNPVDLKGYSDKIQNYKYSSLGLYLNIREDNLALVDKEFIMQIFNTNKNKAALSYLNFVGLCNNEDLKSEVDFNNEKSEYRSERRILVQDISPLEVIEYVAARTNSNVQDIRVKHSKRLKQFRSLTILLLRGVCDMTQKEICSFLGNITQSYAARMGEFGLKLTCEEPQYRDIVTKFVAEHAI